MGKNRSMKVIVGPSGYKGWQREKQKGMEYIPKGRNRRSGSIN